MKAIMPKSWQRLPESEKNKIAEVYEQQMEQQMVIVGNYHAVFEKHCDLVKDGKQSETLDAEMQKIFKRSGYPDEFFKSMIDNWNIKTGGK